MHKYKKEKVKKERKKRKKEGGKEMINKCGKIFRFEKLVKGYIELYF